MKLFYGNILNPKSIKEIDYIINGLLIVNKGEILILEKDVDIKHIKSYQQKYQVQEIIILKDNQFIMPGFIDCHVHAPQCENLGLGLDRPLLQWLEKYTFKAEAKYKDLEYALNMYSHFVDLLLLNGTTTASYFATIHLEASKLLTDIISKKGQRALIGKVNMDINSPQYYCESTKQSLEDTDHFINYVLNKFDFNRIRPVITPRFVVSCSSLLLEKLAEMALKYNLSIQSHLNENLEEINFVKKLYPNKKTYTNVYQHFNLLTSKSYYAHCVHNTPQENELFASHNAGIVHCPNSNFQLKSGIMDMREALNKNIKVGLGTDVSGGCSHSMLDVMKNAIISSKIISYQKTKDRINYNSLDHNEVIYLSTLGGAKILSWDQTIGNFEVGKKFDALVIDLNDLSFFNDSDFNKLDHFKINVQRFIYSGGRENIIQVWIDGVLIKTKIIDSVKFIKNKY